MRKKILLLLTCTMLVGTSTVHADTVVTQDDLGGDGSMTRNVPVSLSIDSTFSVKLPAELNCASYINDEGKIALNDGKYYVWGDIAADKELT